MSYTFTFGLYTQNWNYERLNQLPNFETGFVDPVEDTDILYESDIFPSMNLIKLDTLTPSAKSHPIKWRFMSHTRISTRDNSIPNERKKS